MLSSPCIGLCTYDLLACLCVQVVEALEIMVLAILSAAVKCEWDLSSVQEAAITTVAKKSQFYVYACTYGCHEYAGCVFWISHR